MISLAQDKRDHLYMHRALELARKGRFTTGPNPAVGCVIVKDASIVGEGWHQKAGEPHDALFWRSGGLHVVMADGWKLQVDGRQKKRWLFNLDEDPTEQQNRIADAPERTRELQARLDAFNEEMGPRDFPVLVEGPVPIDRTSADPYVPGEEFAYWPN